MSISYFISYRKGIETVHRDAHAINIQVLVVFLIFLTDGRHISFTHILTQLTVRHVYCVTYIQLSCFAVSRRVDLDECCMSGALHADTWSLFDVFHVEATVEASFLVWKVRPPVIFEWVSKWLDLGASRGAGCTSCINLWSWAVSDHFNPTKSTNNGSSLLMFVLVVRLRICIAESHDRPNENSGSAKAKCDV